MIYTLVHMAGTKPHGIDHSSANLSVTGDPVEELTPYKVIKTLNQRDAATTLPKPSVLATFSNTAFRLNREKLSSNLGYLRYIIYNTDKNTLLRPLFGGMSPLFVVSRPEKPLEVPEILKLIVDPTLNHFGEKALRRYNLDFIRKRKNFIEQLSRVGAKSRKNLYLTERCWAMCAEASRCRYVVNPVKNLYNFSICEVVKVYTDMGETDIGATKFMLLPRGVTSVYSGLSGAHLSNFRYFL